MLFLERSICFLVYTKAMRLLSGISARFRSCQNRLVVVHLSQIFGRGGHGCWRRCTVPRTAALLLLLLLLLFAVVVVVTLTCIIKSPWSQDRLGSLRRVEEYPRRKKKNAPALGGEASAASPLICIVHLIFESAHPQQIRSARVSAVRAQKPL